MQDIVLCEIGSCLNKQSYTLSKEERRANVKEELKDKNFGSILDECLDMYLAKEV